MVEPTDDEQPAMSTTGYVQEGKYKRRHRATFGLLVFVTLILFLLVAAGAGLFGWFLVTNRDKELYLTIFHPDGEDSLPGDSVLLYSEPDNDKDDPVHEDDPLYIENIPTQKEEPNDHDVIMTYILTQTTTQLPQPFTTSAQKIELPFIHVISDEELSDVIQQMWDTGQETYLQPNNDYILNFQGQTNITDTSDRAPKRLFHQMKKDVKRHSPLHKKFTKLLDNFNALKGQFEEVNAKEERELSNFLDELVSTTTINNLELFLRNKGLLEDNIRDLLERVWFKPYGVSQSSGFEHVFVGEIEGHTGDGMNNWIQFYFEEKQRRLDYQGYIHKSELGIVEVKFTWHNNVQTSTFFLGTSPDFDLALYTLCFVTRTNQRCSFVLNNEPVVIETRDVTEEEGLQILSAYPVLR